MVKILFVMGLFSMFNYHTQCCCSGCCDLSTDSAVINKDYNNIVLWFKKRQFEKIREFYNERTKKMYECGLDKDTILSKFNDKQTNDKVVTCCACYNKGEHGFYENPFNNDDDYCEDCLLQKFNTQLNTKTVSVIRYELLKTPVNGMIYYILRLKVISLYVDENGILWIRGNGFVKKNEKLSLVKEENNNNLCFLGLKGYNNVRVYDWTFTHSVLSMEDQKDFKIEACTKKNDKMTLYVFLGNSLNIDNGSSFMFPIGLPRCDKDNLVKIKYSPFNCFMQVFYSVLYGSIYSENDSCNSGCKKICVSGLHYYFDFEKKNHGSMQEVCTEGFLRNDYLEKLDKRFTKVVESFDNNSLSSEKGNALEVFQEVLKLKQSEVKFRLAETIA